MSLQSKAGLLIYNTIKKLEVDLTQEKFNVISVVLWIHLGQSSDPPPFAVI